MPVQFVTDLPDASAPSLGNGVEDEIAVAIDDVLNYGSYRVQAKETTEASWPGAAPNSEVTVSADGDLSGTEDTILPSREDGEAYDVRVRTETEHATGAWTTPVAITTKFPGAANLTVSGVTQTSADLDWQDNSDNEDGFRVQRRKRLGGKWGDWLTVADLAPNTTSYSDDGLQPGREYQHRIEAYTEDATAVSGAVDTTAPSSGVRQARVPSSGWYVEIDHESGTTLTPRLRDDPQVEQQVNGLPQLTIPVPRDEKWQAAGFEDAALRAWRDGKVQPVDTLVDVEVTESETTLIAEGGAALKQRVQPSVQFADAHVVVEDLVSSNTPYTVNVDDPADSVDEVLMQDVDSESAWESILAAYPFAPDDPRYVTSDGRLATRETAAFQDAEFASTFGSGWDLIFADRFGRGVARRASGAGQELTFELGFDYDAPASALEPEFRIQYFDGTHPGFDVRVDGATVFNFGADADPVATDDATFTSLAIDGSDIGSLAAGQTVEITIDTTAAASDNSALFVDCATLIDSRYNAGVNPTYTQSDGGRLPWPRLHPSSIQTETVDAAGLNQIVGGRLASTWDDTGNNQAVALSNDQGGSYPVAAGNSETVDASFGSSSGQIRARFTQSFYDGGSGPVQYEAGQTVDAYELFSDQEETPVLIDRTFDGRLAEVLTQIAEDKNFVYELRRDRSGFSFEMAQLGQRTSDADPSVAQYQVSKNTGDVVERAIIKGGSQSRVGEQATANHGTFVALNQDNLVAGTEAVTDGAGTQYERGTDYEMDYLDGEIKTLSVGSITDGATLTLNYQYKPVASYTKAGVSNPKTVVRSLPAIQSEQTAQQVAYYLVLEFGSPIYSATITIPDAAGWSVIDEVNPSQVPTAGEALQTKAIETSPDATVIRAATEEGLGEAIQRIQSRLEAAETKV